MNDITKMKRARIAAQKEIETWDALIGAHKQPNVQKYILMNRLYTFVNGALGLDTDRLEKSPKLAANFLLSEPSDKLRVYMKYIKGEMSEKEAKAIRDSLANENKVA